MPIYLRPMAPTAERAIVCGDPARSLAIAQAVMATPKMSNHHRGLWSYWGEVEEGIELTVQATGIGAPSAGAVLEELIAAGARRLIRVGTCAAAGPAGPPIGSIAVPERVIAGDGAGAGFGAMPGSSWETDRSMRTTMAESLVDAVPVDVISTDSASAGAEALGEGPAGVHDRQTAVLAALANRYELAFAALLVVSEGSEGRLEDDPLEAAALRAADAATGALSASARGLE